ncbi:MAG: hypothetical protein ABIP95_10580 [Pelobium sp.]
MRRNTFLLLLLLPIVACKSQVKIDLAKLTLNEPIEKVINFKDTVAVEVNTVEYPFCLLLEVDHDDNYTYDGLDLKSQRVIFQINSEKLKTDSITRQGGGHLESIPVKNSSELQKSLKHFDAENQIYGVRIEIKTPELQKQILQKLKAKYGSGIKNPNTDHGLYWNVKKENKFIFYAPDYERLIIINNKNSSKTCYWDSANGTIDFGGCDGEAYFKDMTKNSTKPENVGNKPTVKIAKNWNINQVQLNATNEESFLNSENIKNFERSVLNEGLDKTTLFYQDKYHDFYFYFRNEGKDIENKKLNIISGYSILDFKKVKISFENGLTPGMAFKDAVKLFDAKAIKISTGVEDISSIEIKSGVATITLRFVNDKFNELYVQ